VKLDANEIVKTADRLCRRIRERFPDAGLNGVADELGAVAQRSAAQAEALGRPLYWARAAVGLFLLLMPVGIGYGLWELDLEPHEFVDLADFLSVFFTALETLVFLGAGIAFLVTIELRVKRRRVNAAVHELRALAHLVDAHQLSKDPAFVEGAPDRRTASSPERKYDAFELSRYLDYCSEMLSVVGKIAALYGQRVDDSLALDAVDRVETLTTGLSRKIWQKVTLIRP